MEYQYPLRYLARAFFRHPPAMSGSKALSQLGQVFEADDLSVSPANQIQLHTRALSTVMSIRTVDGSFVVNVGRESIDFEHAPLATKNQKTFEEFVEVAGRVLTLACEIGGQSHRFALLREGLLPEPAGGLDAICHRIMTIPPFLGPVPFEWDWRCAARVERQFNEKREVTNTIAEIKRMSGAFQSGDHAGKRFESLSLNLDINTAPEFGEDRFGPEDAHAFFTSSQAWQADFADEMLKFIGYGVH